MKKIIVLLLILTLAGFGAVGCGAKDKLEEEAAEKLTEELLEQGGDAQDVDIDGDTVTIKGEDGEVTLGGAEWPDSELGKSIPEFDKGKLTGTAEAPNYLSINFEEVDPSDAAAYIEKVKPDFTLDNYELKSDSMISWSGKDDKGLQLSLTLSDSTFNIIIAMEEESE